MEYPVVELPSTCAMWPNPALHDEDKVRYENYCCFVFNLVFDVWEYCGKNHEKANKLLYIDELIRKHQVWWNDDSGNSDAYSDDEFKRFVKMVIETTTKGKKDSDVPKCDSN
jgi:hypothetical protein